MKENYEEIYLSGSNAAQKEKAVDETPLKAADDMQDKNEKTSKAPQPVKEIVALRGPSNKVFRMSDGTERAVFYSQTKHLLDEETNQYREFDIALNEEEGGLGYISSGCGFIARFSKDKSDEKLFSIEKDDCKVTAYAKRPKKNKQSPMGIKGSKDMRANQLVVEGMCDATEVEYTVTPDGIKENIIVSEKQNVYRYPFELVCENVTAELLEDENKVVFCRTDNGEEVFNIPAPYMTDSKGNRSYSVAYDINQKGDGRITLTVTADSDWINADERAFPIAIDPQIMISKNGAITTFGWHEGYLTNIDEYHTIGNDIGQHRMYMIVAKTNLPHNPRIKSARLRLTQGGSESNGTKRYEIYRTDRAISLGYNTPEPTGNLLGCWTSGNMESGEIEIDVTPLMDSISEGAHIVLMRSDDAAGCDDFGYVQIGGAKNTECAPVLEIDYEPSYGYDSSYASHTHDLGPLGQGVVDLATGNLHINSEDFSWAGNRMPVTIRHMYNSALSDIAYTNGALEMPIADFSAMKLGHGWKLNLMQSVVENTDKGVYIYTDENGNHTELQPNLKDGKCVYTADEISYDPATCKLTMGDDTYTFDDKDRLIAISDGHSTMTLHYTSNRLTTVTDGADRDFGFAYNANGYLTSITAPDGTAVSYTYTGNTLTGITYPSGKQVELRYDPVNPAAIVIKGAYGTPDRNVIYTFSNGRVTNVTEQGEQDGTVVTGATAAYTYSVGSRRTIVTATDGSGEPAVHTVYGFGSDGEVVTKYSYTEKEGSAGITGESAGIDPYTGEDAGVASNINNLLRNHAFDGLTGWTAFGGASATVAEKEITAIHGRKLLNLTAPENGTGGIYQQTVTLPASDYVFSAYVYPLSNSSLHLSVTDLDGTIIASGESITAGDFIRLDLPFTLHTAKAVRVCFNVTGKGAWINAPQLENNPVMNEYNMLVNGNFELGGEGWTIDNNFESITDEACFNMGHSLRSNSSFENYCYAFQRVKPKSAIGTRETFTLSGWAKGYGLSSQQTVGDTPAPSTPTFTLKAIIYYVPNADGAQDSATYTAEFAPNTEDWQFASVQFSKEQYKQIDYIMVICEYRYNFGVSYFDDIQLVRNSIETGLTKDDIEPPEDDDTTTEDTTTEQEDTFTEAEDAYGNTITQTQRWKQSESVSYAIYTSSEFTPSSEGANAGNDLVRQTDSRGFNTYYDVDDETSRNMTVTDRCGNKTSYQYDDAGRTTKVTSRDSNGTALAHADYGYDDNDNLIGITRGDSMGYDLAYNGFNRLESIGVHGMPTPLVAYNYKEGSGRLKEIAYANGDVMHVSYNRFGHPILEYWTDACGCTTAYYRYIYDNSGNLARSVDFIHQIEYTYTYEEGRVTRSTVNDVEVSAYDTVLSRTFKNSILYFYDEEGRLERTKISDAQGEMVTYTHSYDADGNATTTAYLDGNNSATMSSSKDGLDRKISDTVRFNNGAITRNFFYHSGAVTPEHVSNNKVCGTATTNLVSKIQFSNGRTIQYWYDGEERISRVLDSYEGETLYTYDALGQLTSETKNTCPECSDCGTTVNITYDNYGNITSKNGVSYTYGNVLWHDRLTGYGDKTISYDAQGNPTNYLGHNLTWEKGRQLKSFDGNIYTYNFEGIRLSKTVDNVRHDYVVDGAKILKETWQDNTLIPIYNYDKEVIGIYYNCEPYYFYKNLQNDVIGISDNDGRVVVTYTYDAWGVCTVLKDDSGVGLANINPYRYRSYYYDTEIGMYYLQSRYYDPVVGRFVNADDAKLLGCSHNIGCNLYTYCSNRPNLDYDVSGFAGASDLAGAVSAILELFENIVKSVASSTSEMVKLRKQLANAKSSGAKKEWIRTLKKQKKNYMSNKNLGTGAISTIATILSYVSLILSLLPLIRKIKDGIKEIAKLIFEVFVELISTIATSIVKLICKFFSVYGFLIGWAVEFLINYLIIPLLFDDQRMSKLVNVFCKRVENKKTFKEWSKAFGYSLQVCF